MSDSTAPTPQKSLDRSFWLVAVLLIGIGACLRLGAAASFQPASTDELIYGAYVKFLASNGLDSYPRLIEPYRAAEEQHKPAVSPLRVTTLIPATVLNRLTGWDGRACLNAVAAASSILLLPVALLFAWRAAGPGLALATLALLVAAPTQLFAARHAGSDIILAFWALVALWSLWESLQRPGKTGWLCTLAISIAMVLLSKETSFLAIVAVLAVLVANRWAKFGDFHRGILVAIGIGLVLGAAVLTVAGGGWAFLSSGSAGASVYEVITGDGPWFRYVFDLLVVSPLIVVLALTMLVRLDASARPQLFVAIFLAVSYVALCTVPNGINLRFASLWDFPLCFLAASGALPLLRPLHWRPVAVTSVLIAMLAWVELAQYERIFVKMGVHDPTTPALLQAVDMLK
jgi:hypothetical protein